MRSLSSAAVAACQQRGGFNVVFARFCSTFFMRSLSSAACQQRRGFNVVFAQ
jgi:hypothetical protein